MGSASLGFLCLLDWAACLLEKGRFLNYENEKISYSQTALHDTYDMVEMLTKN